MSNTSKSLILSTTENMYFKYFIECYNQQIEIYLDSDIAIARLNICSWWLRNYDHWHPDFLPRTTKEINKQLNKLVKKDILRKETKQGVATFYYPSTNYKLAIEENNILRKVENV
jgi:hypothetical protein